MPVEKVARTGKATRQLVFHLTARAEKQAADRKQEKDRVNGRATHLGGALCCRFSKGLHGSYIPLPDCTGSHDRSCLRCRVDSDVRVVRVVVVVVLAIEVGDDENRNRRRGGEGSGVSA